MILRLSSGGAPGRDSTLCANSTKLMISLYNKRMDTCEACAGTPYALSTHMYVHAPQHADV